MRGSKTNTRRHRQLGDFGAVVRAVGLTGDAAQKCGASREIS